MNQRLESLDVFRGFTIASMMVVNNLGDWKHIYGPLGHAEWHGWTFTDTIFPFFLWIVGVAMTLSFSKRVERGEDRRHMALHLARRAAMIFALGLLLAGFPYYRLATIRIPGVLQRIAICALIAGLLLLYTSVRVQLIVLVACLAGYWLLMGTSHLEPNENFSGYVDRLLLSGHMWSQTKTWDPEGTVSTLPAIATTLFGVLAGHLLRLRREPAERVAWMFTIGSGLVFLALCLATWMPINKKIWTTPFCLFMAGLAYICFALCYWLVDIQGWRRWTRPFAIYGMNAIAVYVLAGLVARLMGLIKIGGVSLQRIVYDSVFAGLGSPYFASMLYGVAFSLLMYAVAWAMYRRGWFVRL